VSIIEDLTHKVILLSELTQSNVRLCVVSEEEVLVLGVRFNPVFKRGVLHELMVGLGGIVLGLLLEEKLLEVSVVEDVRVHAPACMGALPGFSVEPEGVLTHQSDKLLRRQVALCKTLYNKTTSRGLSSVLDGLVFICNIFAAHVEDHGGAATVLNSGVPTKLDQVSVAQAFGDHVTFFLDLSDLLHGEVQLLTLGDWKLLVEFKDASGTSIDYNS
jgi:hypothetical protein